MKLQGRRQSKNIEVQTDKERKVAEYGKKFQDKVMDSTNLRDGTKSIARQKDNRDEMTAVMSNPGRHQTAFPSTRSPAERRRIKDPKPQSFEFFKHETTEK